MNWSFFKNDCIPIRKFFKWFLWALNVMTVNKQRNLTSRSSRRVIYFIFLRTPFTFGYFLIQFPSMRKLWSFLWTGAKYRGNTCRKFSLLCEIGDSVIFGVRCQGLPRLTSDSERAKFSCSGEVQRWGKLARESFYSFQLHGVSMITLENPLTQNCSCDLIPRRSSWKERNQ